MKEYKLELTICMPDSVSEKAMDVALADSVYNMGGELINSSEYQCIGNYPARGECNS